MVDLSTGTVVLVAGDTTLQIDGLENVLIGDEATGTAWPLHHVTPDCAPKRRMVPAYLHVHSSQRHFHHTGSNQTAYPNLPLNLDG